MRLIVVKAKETIFLESFVPLYPELYRMALAMLGSRDDAADVVQDTMVKIWQIGAGLADIGQPAAYARKVLRRVAIDFIRSRMRLESLGAMPEQAAGPGGEPDTAEFMERIIATLPAGQQTVVRLSAMADRRPDEIAALTGLSPQNVRQLLSRGRRRIFELYKKYMS